MIKVLELNSCLFIFLMLLSLIFFIIEVDFDINVLNDIRDVFFGVISRGINFIFLWQVQLVDHNL